MEDFSADNVRNAIAEVQKATSSANEQEAAEAKIELEVCGSKPPIFPETGMRC